MFPNKVFLWIYIFYCNLHFNPIFFLNAAENHLHPSIQYFIIIITLGGRLDWDLVTSPEYG